MKAVYPSDAAEKEAIRRDPEAENAMAVITDIITAVRNIRGEMNISPSQSLAMVLQSPDETTRSMIKQQQDVILDLARLHALSIETPGEQTQGLCNRHCGRCHHFCLP